MKTALWSQFESWNFDLDIVNDDDPDDVLVAVLKEIVGKESRILQNPAICLEGGENFGLWRYLYVFFYITLDISKSFEKYFWTFEKCSCFRNLTHKARKNFVRLGFITWPKLCLDRLRMRNPYNLLPASARVFWWYTSTRRSYDMRRKG